MATVLNVTEILKRSDGTEIKISGDSKFYAQNNYANLILLDIEDGGSLEACALINFTQQTRQSFTSHNFFMKPVGIVTRVVNDEVINAYQYAIQVPKLVLQNNTKGVIETDLTVTVSFGANYKGYFSNQTNLNISLPPTEQLQNDLSIAYVVELEQFLQVQYNPTTSVYEWVEVDYVGMFLTQKQYSLSPIYIQPGYSSPQGIAPISVSNTQVIMNILNDLEVLYNSLEEGLSSHITDLNNPHEVTAEQVDTYNKTAIDLKDADTLEEAKDFTYSRTVIDNKDANTLQEAKDYTYSKVEIDNKDANTLQEAKNYTDILGIVVEQNKQDIAGIEEGLVKIDDITITKNDDQELEVSDLVINDINSRVKETDFNIYQNIVQDLLNGTTVVKKAEQDENGNNIKDTYATVTYVDGKISGVYRPSGNWNANTNTPTLANNEPTNAGKVYYVTTAGTQFGLTFAIGDKLAFIEGGVATKWDNVDDVTSVNGKVGTVVINADDIPFNGSGTNYLTTKNEVEGAIEELDTIVKTNADNVALKVNTSDIVDNLTSTDTNKPLSANQGKALKDLVDATVGNIDAILDSILGV